MFDNKKTVVLKYRKTDRTTVLQKILLKFPNELIRNIENTYDETYNIWRLSFETNDLYPQTKILMLARALHMEDINNEIDIAIRYNKSSSIMWTIKVTRVNTQVTVYTRKLVKFRIIERGTSV